MQNDLKSNEWQRVLIVKTFKIEIQKRGRNSSPLLQNWFPPRDYVRLPLSFGNLKSLRKVLFNHVQCIEI